MRRKKLDKNTIFLSLIIAIFVLVFSTYIYSLIKGDLNPHNTKELVDEVIITKPEEDKEYNSYCNVSINYTLMSTPKRVDNHYTQDILITLTNNSEEEYTSWQFKIPNKKVTIDKLSTGSFTVHNNHTYIKNSNQLLSLKPGESINIEATVAYKDDELQNLVKVFVITSCGTEKSSVVESGNAKLSLGPLEAELTPEIYIESTTHNQTIYAIYLTNNSNYDLYNYRFQIAYDYGEYISLTDAKVDINYNSKIINATNNDIIKKNTKSSKYLLTLENIPDDYIPNIVAIGQIKE